MKKRILVALAFVLSSLAGYGQTFNFGLGVPMSTAGWTLNSPTTYAITDTIVLQDSYPDTSGFVYYATPVNLTACPAFVGSLYMSNPGVLFKLLRETLGLSPERSSS